MPSEPTIPPLAEALGRIPSGLFILTVRRDDHETGMLASWVMQAGFEPPALTVAVRRDRYVADWLSAGAPFVLNIVPDQHKTLLKHFGRGFDVGQAAFDGLSIERCGRGVVILSDALGHLECRAAGHLDSGDHRVFLATIEGGRISHSAHPSVHVRKNGLRY